MSCMGRSRKESYSKPWERFDFLYGGIKRPFEFSAGITFSSSYSDLSSPSIKKNFAESKVIEKELERKVKKIIEEIKKERSSE
ncbi:MAG: hypothetical protein NWF08_00285 [Candidatus Bathyarchaeota archaeon]|nr:hypothetical protein [Candidatus Bathyarchaeota archaeon]